MTETATPTIADVVAADNDTAADIVALAVHKGSVRAMRHEALETLFRKASLPLRGISGLSREEQILRIDAAIRATTTAQEVLIMARHVIESRASLPAGPSEPDDDALPPPATAGRRKAETLGHMATARGWHVDLVDTPDETQVELACPTGHISFAYSRVGRYEGGVHMLPDGKSWTLRNPQDVRNVLSGGLHMPTAMAATR